MDLDIVLVNGLLYKTLPRQTLLVAEDLSTNFKIGEESLFLQFRGNKYEIFDVGFARCECQFFFLLVEISRKSRF